MLAVVRDFSGGNVGDQEGGMSFHLASMQTFALQHLLERGRVVIRNEPIDEAVRTDILDELISIISEANRGSEALRASNLLFAAEEQPAFDSFAVFYRYLADIPGEDIGDELDNAKSTLQAIRDGNLQDESKRSRVGELIDHLLMSLSRERMVTPLVAPREFSVI